jgi:general nucleoside transport system permease protein
MEIMKNPSTWINIGFRLGAIILALLFTTVILLAAGAPPFAAYKYILVGAFENKQDIANVLVAWVPLMLVTSGLLVTFSAGLWNIGVEGQITLGAIFTTGLLRLMIESSIPPFIIILLAMLAGIIGGAIWASVVGILKTYGGVNEIFGGLGMNFVSTALTLWLIFGPWKRPGTGSMSGTEPFPQELWLPQFTGLRLSPWSLIIALFGIAIAYFLLQNTNFGLRLKAVGRNKKASFLLGIPTNFYTILAFMICGALAGLAGSLQILGVYHRLIPSISSGYGYLGLLIAMLTNYQALWTVPVTFFFASLNIGSIQLPIILKLDSTLSGVLQGSLVLFVLMMDGIRKRYFNRFGQKKERTG